MMARFYVLDENGEPVASDAAGWSTWFQANSPHVIAETITATRRVSTIFGGINRRFRGQGKPLLYETAVFDLQSYTTDEGEEVFWWPTRQEAADGHADVVAAILAEESVPLP